VSISRVKHDLTPDIEKSSEFASRKRMGTVQTDSRPKDSCEHPSR
jgi:hypothetical protein